MNLESKSQLWLAWVVASALGLGAGFVSGSWMGHRERRTLRAHQAKLLAADQLNKEQIEQIRAQLEQVTGELDAARQDAARREAQQLEEREAESLPGPVLPGPERWPEYEDSLCRIEELEREVALLKASQAAVAMPVLGVPLPPQTVPTPTQPAPAAMTAPTPASAKQQCTAITQKGMRCSRTARSNGLCWQHGG